MPLSQAFQSQRTVERAKIITFFSPEEKSHSGHPGTVPYVTLQYEYFIGSEDVASSRYKASTSIYFTIFIGTRNRSLADEVGIKGGRGRKMERRPQSNLSRPQKTFFSEAVD